jgi:hypothetical protein
MMTALGFISKALTIFKPATSSLPVTPHLPQARRTKNVVQLAITDAQLRDIFNREA